MIQVRASSVIDAPLPAIWSLLRDFGAISQWLPGVCRSDIDEGRDAAAVGSTRHLTFADGSGMREQLLALSDVETSITFAIIESALPITNYVSTIRLQSISDGDRTFITWSGAFETSPDQEQAMSRRMHDDIYQAGFDALKRRFEQKS